MKKLLIALVATPLIVLGISFSAIGQSKYYVATPAQGGNDANAGTTISTPFASVSKAVSVAIVPGDTIFVRSGVYTVTSTIKITKPGTAAKHIVLTVYKPDMVDANSRPVLDCSSMAVSSSNRGITLTGANYWDIYGLVIKGAGDNGMNISATAYTSITFCSFTRNRDTGLQLGGGANHINVINCDSYENADLGAGTTTSGGNADGFAPKLDIGDTIIFRGCRAWMNSDDGWDGYMRTTAGLDTITTFLEDCWAFRNGYYWLDNSTTSSQNGNGFKLGGSDTKDLGHNFVVVKCLAFMNKANGFDQNSNAGSIYIYNGSAYKNLGRDYYMTSSGVTYKPGAQLVLINNLSLGAGGVSIPTSSTSSRQLVTATNSFSTSTTSSEILSFDTTGVTGMRSVDGSLPELPFMHLNPSAPTPYKYIDKGTPLPDVYYHGQKGVPYNGSAPDLGAFELNNGAVPVKMISFSAFNNSNDVTLSWKIASEINNKGWTVERSGNGSSEWTALGFVQGAQNNSNVNSYSFVDRNHAAGTYYYRLKQFDLDGTITYSNVLIVKVATGRKTASIEAFPNPFKTSVTLRYYVAGTADVMINVYNQQGKLISSTNEGKQQAGFYQKLLNGNMLPAGNYIVRVNVGKDVFSTILTK